MRVFRFRLRTKLLLLFLVVGIVSAAATGFQGYITARDDLMAASFEKLTAIRENKKGAVERYFEYLKTRLEVFAKSPSVIGAMEEFSNAYGGFADNLSPQQIAEMKRSLQSMYEKDFMPRLGLATSQAEFLQTHIPDDDVGIALQFRYIVENPYDAGMREKLDKSQTGARYDAVHEKYHPYIRTFRELNGLYDIFLVDARSGNIVYSVYKELDFATDLNNGVYRNTNFANAFRQITGKPGDDEVVLVDFGFYEPSYNAPAAILATPVYSGGNLIGVAAFQVPIDEIDRVMTGNRRWTSEGLQQTGETYLAGPDFRMRSDSRQLIEQQDDFFAYIDRRSTGGSVVSQIKHHGTTILFLEVHTNGVESALAGETGIAECENYLGKTVLCAYTPLSTEGLNWVLVSEIERGEVLKPVFVLQMKFIVVASLVSLFVAVMALAFANTISRPIRQLERDILFVGKGDFSKKVSVESHDEIGALGRAFNQMSDDLQQTLEQLVRADKLIALGTLVSGVGHEINNPNSYIMMNAQSLQTIWKKMLPVLHDYCRSTGSDGIGPYKMEFLEQTIPNLLNGTLEGSQRIQTIVSDMKQFISPSASVEDADINLNAVVRASIDLVRQRIDKATTRFSCNIHDGDIPVRGNFQRLEQVIINLLLNACEALRDRDDRIALETRIQSDGRAILTIEDTGKGIPDAILSRITDPFFTTKRESGGTGLGLSISARIVQEHGGTLEFASKTESGTTVTLSLPIRKQRTGEV